MNTFYNKQESSMSMVLVTHLRVPMQMTMSRGEVSLSSIHLLRIVTE